MNSAIAQIISVFNPSILLFRVAELQELILKVFLGGCRNFGELCMVLQNRAVSGFPVLVSKINNFYLWTGMLNQLVSLHQPKERKKEKEMNKTNHAYIFLSDVL